MNLTDEQIRQTQDNWLIDRTAVLILSGLSEVDAKIKAMEDWHTYEAERKDMNNEQ